MSGTAGRHRADVIHLRGRQVSRVACPESGLTACLSPYDGAELSSLTVRDGSKARELLYRGNDWRPVDGWPGRSPWLWPVAGRTYGEYDARGGAVPQSVFHWGFGDRVLPMPHHGFARLKHWREQATGVDDAGAFAYASYRSNGEDHGLYPFNYRLDSGVTLIDSSITLTMRVTAGDDNERPMPFTIGQHITFDLASWWGKDWLRGTLGGLGRSARGIDPLMLAGDRIALPPGPVKLSDGVAGDLLIPAVPGRALRLASPDGAKHIDLSFTAGPLPSEDAALWVTHCDPAGRYFCLEPWVGWPNGINSGKGRIELQPGEAWSFSMQLIIMGVGQPPPAGNTVPGEIHINPAAMDPSGLRKKTPAPTRQRVTEEQ